jgi:CRP-like cAMP-binding protein
MDPDEWVEISPGISKQVGRLTPDELRAAIERSEAQADDLRERAAHYRQLLDEMQATGGGN